jgi:hypothetical protein
MYGPIDILRSERWKQKVGKAPMFVVEEAYVMML